jgi:glutathione S-transferase
MAVTLYIMSGSPYAWRVWLALKYKDVDCEVKTLSYDAGDFEKPELTALNPRRRVPVLKDDGFVLYESAAIVEYVEDRWPAPPLFSPDPQARAIERRLVREVDQYVAAVVERLVRAVLFTPPDRRDSARIAAISADLKKELALWETMVGGEYLAGRLSAADFALFPLLALVERMSSRNPGLIPTDLAGPGIAAWMRRMEALPVVQETWPRHWR